MEDLKQSEVAVEGEAESLIEEFTGPPEMASEEEAESLNEEPEAPAVRVALIQPKAALEP